MSDQVASEVRPRVFVIMPFSDEFDAVYEDLLKKPLEEVGFEVRRADTLLNQRNILQDVVRGIADADLVVADVTGLNANVLYELGLAHALGKRTIMITQQLEELPFDLRPYRANEYSTNFRRATELLELIKSVGEAVLEGKADFSNPVQDYAPDALSASSQVSSPPTSAAKTIDPDAKTPPQGDAPETQEEEADSPGYIEYVVQMQTASERVAEIGEEIGSLTNGVGEMIEKQTAKMSKANASLGDRAAGALLTIARDAGRGLDEYVTNLEPLIRDLKQNLDAMVTGTNAVARERTIESDEEASTLREEVDSLREIEESIAEAAQGMSEFAQVMIDQPNFERNLSAASRRASALVSDAAETLEGAEAEFARARGLLEERIREHVPTTG